MQTPNKNVIKPQRVATEYRTERPRCVRFATTVASGHATLATKRTLLLTWAGLPPAGSHQLCLAHSLNDLVGAREPRRRHFEAERPRRDQVDNQIELGQSLDFSRSVSSLH